MKKERTKGFISGVVVSVLIFSLVGTTVATVGKRTAELDYNDIKLYINGQFVTPTDANGNAVEPFAINGTTYLPVRAVGNALNMNVHWDASTNTVILDEKKTWDGTSWVTTPTAPPTPVSTPVPTPVPTASPAPMAPPAPTPMTPSAVRNGYSAAPWIPDFGKVNGITPSYFTDETSIFATYITDSFDMVETYIDVLESAGMTYDDAATTAFKEGAIVSSPTVYSYNGSAAYMVVIGVGSAPGEVVIFAPIG